MPCISQFSFSHLYRTACLSTLIKAETLGFQPRIIEIIHQASPVFKGFSSNSNFGYLLPNLVTVRGDISQFSFPHSDRPGFFSHAPPIHQKSVHLSILSAVLTLEMRRCSVWKKEIMQTRGTRGQGRFQSGFLFIVFLTALHIHIYV